MGKTITMEVIGYQQLFGYQHTSNIFFCVHHKEIHTGLEQLEGEYMMTEFLFLGESSL